MNFLEPRLLPLAVAILIPGFVAMKSYSLLVPMERQAWPDVLLEVFAYGMVNYAVFFWLADLAASLQQSDPRLGYLLGVVFLFGTPVGLAVGANVALRSERLRPWVLHPTPTGWDHFFGKGERCWVLCHLSDGSLVGGLYGTDSLASSHPRDPDIYLEEVWRVTEDGVFEERIESTAGMYVQVEDCQLVEFFEWRGSADAGQGDPGDPPQRSLRS